MTDGFSHPEKKVEYIELIYDLIFVYIIGRNNDLMHVMKGGFIDPMAFLTYMLTALIVLQIWFSTALFINRYGENDRVMHAGIFVSMYLLYFMARGIRRDWQGFYMPFNGAWALILGNLAAQYAVQLRRSNAGKVWEAAQIRQNLRTILIQIAIIAVSMPVYRATGIPLSPLAMGVGIALTLAGSGVNRLMPVDFGHLTERVMLFVVFTFGEMIIGITGYFDGGLTWTTVYFSLCAFLIIAGLFGSYGMLYDRLLDRRRADNGTVYMALHIPLILSLNQITAAMEFMREAEVRELPKNLFLVGSFALYYAMFYLIMRYNKEEYRPDRRMKLELWAGLAAFVLLMLLTYRNGAVSIAVTALFIGFVDAALMRFRRRRDVRGA